MPSDAHARSRRKRLFAAYIRSACPGRQAQRKMDARRALSSVWSQIDQRSKGCRERFSFDLGVRECTPTYMTATHKRKKALCAPFSSIWRKVRDSNPRKPHNFNGFQDRRFRPLSQPSVSLLSSVPYPPVKSNAVN